MLAMNAVVIFEVRHHNTMPEKFNWLLAICIDASAQHE